MPDDKDDVVKKEPVSEEKEPVSPEKVEEETTETPSPEELLQKKIEEAVSKAVTTAVATETEKAKRELQSTKDKAKAEVESAQRRARMAEGIQTATRSQIQTLEPEVAKDFELAQLRAESQGRTTFEQEEQTRRQQEAYGKSLNDSLHAHLRGLGIEPNDERIDWAEDAPD